MKLLLDENISWRIISKLKPHFVDVLHVNFADLTKPITDKTIWNFAKNNNYIIITNDSDFLDLMSLLGFPPKIVLIITGNQSPNYISNLLINKKKDIELLHHSVEYGLIEIF
ncbi:MAG: DUF5615 family PIN-like protein [Bacteroidetes bacterium]|nr:DUF5615 family PIN-like protein [Bacteroidota bacterium]